VKSDPCFVGLPGITQEEVGTQAFGNHNYDNGVLLYRFSESLHRKDITMHTSYIRMCEKIFQCDSGCHLSDLDKVYLVAPYLNDNVNTA
jgi:hypothetical protein